MDYLDNQAEESDGSTDTSINEDQPKLKKRKIKDKYEKERKKKRKQIESSSEDEDDEDDDDKAAEEMKGFIADEEEDADDDDKSEKSDNEEELEELDEDDLDLIDENLDSGPSKKKRIVETFDSDEEDDRTAIQKKLFGDNDDDDDEPQKRRPLPDDTLSGSDAEGSEDNFIVNEDGERPMKRRHHKRDLNIPEGALDEARDIFGVEDFNLDDFYNEDEEEGLDEEDEDIVDEDEEAPVRRVRSKKNKVSIYDTLDPADLERGFMSTADQKIMLDDRPERFIMRKTAVTEADEAELEIESKWIYRHAFHDNAVSCQVSRIPNVVLSKSDDPNDKHAAEVEVQSIIKEILRCVRNQMFEIPFIAFYRRETYNNMLSLQEMWRIFEFDEKWCHLNQRKNKIMELMKRMQSFQIESQSVKRMVSEIDIHELHSVDTEEALSDVYAQFQLYWGADVGKMVEWEKSKRGGSDSVNTDEKFKIGSRTDRYQFCYDHGISEFAAKFGLTARQFAENMDWKRHEIDQCEVPIREAAADYVGKPFNTTDEVIQNAIYMVAKEISRQPLVREKVRRAYRRRATLAVRPTKTGRVQIDESSPVFMKRYIKGKPIKEIKDDEFLYFWKLKEAGLITMKISVENEREIANKETLADEVMYEGPFKKDDYTELVEEWNGVREQAVRMAVDEMLKPFFQEELEKKLLDEAKLCVAEQCAERLKSRIERQGFKPIGNGYDNDEEDHEFARLGEVRVMAIAYPEDMDEASFGAIVNEDGVLLDYVKMAHFMKRGDRDQNTKLLKKESMDFFKRMVERKRPHIIGLCAEDIEAIRLKKDLEIAIKEMVREGVIPNEIQVAFLEADVAKVYMNSKTALSEFPEYARVLRLAVSAARSLVDPLIEIASLWNPDEDMLCWQMHTLQKEVDKEVLLSLLNNEMINRVCEVGVDLNRCLDNPHHAGLVQFIAGLGPRKAVYLLKEIRHTTQVLGSRTNLVTHSKMGPKVFMNSAGFIKIEQQRIGDRSDEYVEVLDGSRVHPETYEWARKMAVDALEVDDNADPAAAIEELINAPERLKDLDLDAFAEELDRQGFGEKRATLYDISRELHERYRDRRKPYESMRLEEVYEVLSKELKDMLKPKKIVQGTVVGVQYRRLKDSERETPDSLPEQNVDGSDFICQYCREKRGNINQIYDHIRERDPNKGGCLGVPVGVKVRLDNKFSGFIPNKLLSNDPKSFKHPLERVQIGRMIYCQVQSVDIDKFSCLLSCRSQDLQGESKLEKDRYWDIDAEAEDKDTDAIETKKRIEARPVTKRVIQHSAFQNISYQEAQRQLSKAELGECIIRPSSKSADRLTATWKVADGVYANVEIQEEDKEQPFTLGRRLIINGEEFEDLNEIIARYIQPMAQFAREIVLYKYFIDGMYAEETNEIEKKLRDERKKNPSRIPYFLTPSTKWPGKFMISFTNLKYRAILHEYMTVTPDGIRFRQRMFPDFNALLNWFKANFNDVPHGASYR